MTTAVIATAVFGIGLLAGGGAAALWTDDAEVAAPVVIAGDLDVALDGGPTWWDLSPDVAGTPFGVGADFLTVPGDVVAVEQAFTTEAVGDNMLAEMVVGVSGLSNVAPGTLTNDITATYSLYDGAVVVVGPIAVGQQSTVDFDPGAQYTVRITFTWRAGAPDRIRVNEQATVEALVTLRQMRP